MDLEITIKIYGSDLTTLTRIEQDLFDLDKVDCAMNTIGLYASFTSNNELKIFKTVKKILSTAKKYGSTKVRYSVKQIIADGEHDLGSLLSEIIEAISE